MKVMRILAPGAVLLIANATVAYAQQTSADEAAVGSGEIIVTATKRSENLQDVPIAVAAVNSEELAAQGVKSVTDLTGVVSGTILTMSNAGGVSAFIRGVGSQDATPGQENAVATYVDGVYYALPVGNNIPFNNIERIEVLKGPQGTLFGRNATGGLINVITRTPSQDTHVDASMSYGNYQTATAKFYGTTGLTNDVAADLAMYVSDQGKGFGRNVFDGRDVYQSQAFAVRSKILFTPGPDTRITLAGDYSYQKSDFGLTYHSYRGTLPALGNINPPLGFYDTNSNLDPIGRVKAYGGSARLEQGLGFANLVSITALRHVDNSFVFDNDDTAVNFSRVQSNDVIGRSFTQELQLVSDGAPGTPFKWIVGAFYMHDKSGFGDPTGLFLTGAAVNGEQRIIGVIRSKSYSGFGEASYKFGDAQLTLGARYTSDERELHSRITVLNTSGAIVRQVTPADQRKTFNKLTYRALFDYHFTPDVMGYLSYSRGFKSGNFNAVNFANPSFQPETLDAYEVGLKSQVLDRRITFNAAGYYYDYKNLQLVSQNGLTQITQNAGKARVYGLDVDTSVRVTDTFNVSGGLAYIDAKFVDFRNAVSFVPKPAGGATQIAIPNAAGNRLFKAPTVSWNLRANYELPTDVGTFRANTTLSHVGKFFWSADNSAFEPSHDMLSAKIGWSNPSGRFSINVFGANLLDERVAINVSESGLRRSYSAGAPRTYGIELVTKL